MTGQQPDWDAIAEKFDLWLPQIAPVGEKLLDCVQVSEGEKVLDVASGTGEPALTLARRCPGAQVIGTDAAAGMARAAQNKVVAEGLGNIDFRAMSAESLDFPDNHFDVVICRFGVMLFEDSQQGLMEMCRVLKPGGRFALSVWHTAETMPIMNLTNQLFRDKIDESALPPIDKMVSVGQQSVLDPMLIQAGFSERQYSIDSVNYEFPSFDAFWNNIEASQILKVQMDQLAADQHAVIRDEMAWLARDFTGAESFSAPHHYLLAWGKK